MSEQKMRDALKAAYMAGNQHGHNSTVEGYWSEAEDVANEYADEALAQQPAAHKTGIDAKTKSLLEAIVDTRNLYERTGPECRFEATPMMSCEHMFVWADAAEEILTGHPDAVVELTDDEIESVAHRSCSIYVHGRDQIYHRYEFGRLTLFDFATKLIQTYRAKQGGVA